MELVRWNPWRTVSSRSHANRIWDEFFHPTAGRGSTTMVLNWNPVVDVYETDESYVIKADLPGVDKKDIALDVKDRILTLKGERQVDEEVKKENAHCRERAYGRFERSFRLPSHVDGDKITADYKDGVLRVEIPKPESTKPKQITVH